MPADMILKEETSTRLVLEKNEPFQWSRYILGLIVPPAILLLAYLAFGLEALFWISAVIVLLIEALFVLVISSSLTAFIVTIDLNSKLATSLEKYPFGRTKEKELKLEQVSRVVIHCEEWGHGCQLLLESSNGQPFKVNSFFPTETTMENMKIFGKRLGDLLQKPVALKMTDNGRIGKEEIIQP